MSRRIRLVVALLCMLGATSQVPKPLAASSAEKCVGSNVCDACKNCRYCDYCHVKKGSCGVCAKSGR